MQQSEQINEIAAALSKAQSQIEGAVKDANNPFYKSKYADLSSIIEAVKGPLANNGLSIVQLVGFDDENREFLETQISHSSGQFFRGRILIKSKDQSPQAQGSAISYARRYALQAALNVPVFDDDAEMAQASFRKPQTNVPPVQTVPLTKTSEPTPEAPTSPATATSIQMNRISYLINKLKLDPAKLAERLDKQFGKTEVKALSKTEADWLIKNLEGVKS